MAEGWWLSKKIHDSMYLSGKEVESVLTFAAVNFNPTQLSIGLYNMCKHTFVVCSFVTQTVSSFCCPHNCCDKGQMDSATDVITLQIAFVLHAVF